MSKNISRIGTKQGEHNEPDCPADIKDRPNIIWSNLLPPLICAQSPYDNNLPKLDAIKNAGFKELIL